jgi:2-succinyl-6-hydroxy-2,4-cyclohexadiene-1-carboxylate synthase
LNHQKKPVLIFLHGFLGEWDELNFLKNYSLSFDIVGIPWGKLFLNNPDISFLDLAIKIKACCDLIKNQDCILYGYSMGGRLAMQVISLYPGYFKGLILESAHCGFNSGFLRREQERFWENKLLEFPKTSTKEFIKEWYKQSLFTKTAKKLSYTQWQHKYSYQIHDLLHMAVSLQTARHGYFIPTLHAWNKPILYLYGEDDSKYQVLANSEFKLLSHCKRMKINNADHNAHCCNKAQLSAEVNHFILNIS